MALTTQQRTNWVRVPSTHTSDRATPLKDIPPPCLRIARGGERNLPPRLPRASCSPVGGKGRLVLPTLAMMLAGETVEAPTRMPANDGVTTPSLGGREGIVGTGVSCRPEANRRIASFLYYSYCRK